MAKEKHVSLTDPEIGHLLDLLGERYRSGHYYGNREQYYARNSRLMDKLIAALSPIATTPTPEVQG